VNVELAQRGEVMTNGRSETVVAVKGLAENAQVLIGSLGALREGTATKFTQAAAVSAASK
jgi:hypothetical protein